MVASDDLLVAVFDTRGDYQQRHTGVVDSPNGHCFALETCTNGMDFCSYGEYQTNFCSYGERREE